MNILRSFKKMPWILGLIVGVVLIGIGVALDQPDMIFQKAIRICLECIGIG